VLGLSKVEIIVLALCFAALVTVAGAVVVVLVWLARRNPNANPQAPAPVTPAVVVCPQCGCRIPPDPKRTSDATVSDESKTADGKDGRP